MKTRRISKQKIFMTIGDIIIIFLSINLAFLLRVKQSMFSYSDPPHPAIIVIFLYCGCLISFYIFDLYNTDKHYAHFQVVTLIILASILVTTLAMVFFYFFPFGVGRGVFFISLVLIGIFSTVWRFIFPFLFKLTIAPKNMIFVGNDEKIDAAHSLVMDDPEYRIIGCSHDSDNPLYHSKLDYLGPLASLEKIISEHDISDIIVAMDLEGNEGLNQKLLHSKMLGVDIFDLPTFYEIRTGKISIQYSTPIWFVTSQGFTKLGSRFYLRMKRINDIVTTSMILVLSLPLILLIAAIIRLTSRGPVFFIQERLGKNQKPFKLYKFRTMISDAENEGPQWSQKGDKRITKVGGILRKARLDELPQFFNILKGDMSIFGPRPERYFFVEKLLKEIPFYSLRFTVKPGLTGWAQVNYKYGNSVQDSLEKLQFDLYYIKNMSFLLDLKIFLKTIKSIVFGLGE